MARLGIKCGLYRNTASTTPWATPTWDEVTCIGNLTVPPSWDAAEVLTRASRVKMSVKTMLGIEITGNLKVNNLDADYLAILAALQGDGKLDLMILNGKSAEFNARGYRFWAQVFSASQDQGTGAVLFDEIAIRPTVPDIDTELPQTAVVAASGSPPTITYATIAV